MHGAARPVCPDWPAHLAKYSWPAHLAKYSWPAHLAKYSWPAVAWQSNNTHLFFIHAMSLFRTAGGVQFTLALFTTQPCSMWLLLAWLATLVLN